MLRNSLSFCPIRPTEGKMLRRLPATVGVWRLSLYLHPGLRSHVPARVHQEHAFSYFEVQAILLPVASVSS